MEQEDQPPSRVAGPSPQRTAKIICGELEQVELRTLSLRQHALFADVEGLLDGMARGKVAPGQSRIQEDLVEIVSLFEGRMKDLDDKSPEENELRQSVRRLLKAIGMAAASGLAVPDRETPSRTSQPSRDR